jgi:CheY-like chemotaxis protein
VAKILFLDDDATNRNLLVTLLGYRGHALRKASDGAEALAVVSAETRDLVVGSQNRIRSAGSPQ